MGWQSWVPVSTSAHFLTWQERGRTEIYAVVGAVRLPSKRMLDSRAKPVIGARCMLMKRQVAVAQTWRNAGQRTCKSCLEEGRLPMCVSSPVTTTGRCGVVGVANASAVLYSTQSELLPRFVTKLDSTLESRVGKRVRPVHAQGRALRCVERAATQPVMQPSSVQPLLECCQRDRTFFSRLPTLCLKRLFTTLTLVDPL